jgi:cellulose synthase/poly-beta-1,6-N-acetylglucosamine synthase-like glycosyltransferase
MYVFIHVFFLLFALVSSTYFIYIVIHLLSWLRIPVSITTNTYTPKTKISVIIAARNEEATISKCLAAISSQTYPIHLFEIIVVNDHSTDKTKEVTEKILLNIKISSKVISNKENEQGKKNAITEAIKNSTGELIVITDADCQSNPKWLSTIESEYQKTGAYMLCGPVGIMDGHGFLGYFQSLEEDGFSLLSGAGIKIGVPLLCSGANIAYTRRLFNDVEGFKGIDNNPTGDDVLLMFKVHKKYPGKIGFVKSTDALVSTTAPASLKGFLSQRIRWGSKGLYSKNFANSFVSILVFGSNLLAVIAILFSIISVKLFPLLIFGLAVKVIADFLLLLFATNFFGRKKLLWIFPFAEMLTMLYISWVGIAANFSSYNWKDRQYKHSV